MRVCLIAPLASLTSCHKGGKPRREFSLDGEYRAGLRTDYRRLRSAQRRTAMLDVLSGGRLEFGIGRGYQPREAEVFGWPFATIQDQERNRAYYQEAYEIILKAWTEPSFSYHGQFFTIPPVFTRWNHQQTIAYFANGKSGRK